MLPEEIHLNHTYAAVDGAHFRTVREILVQNGVTRVRYWDSQGKNSCIPLEKFAAWAHVLAATPQPRPASPNKHKKPPPIWPGD